MGNILIVGSGAMAKYIVAQIYEQFNIYTLGNFWGESFIFQNNLQKKRINQYQNFNPIIKYDCIFWLTSTEYNWKILQENNMYFRAYKGTVINFQNGMGYEELFYNNFPLAKTYFGSTTQAVLKTKNGIQNTGKGLFYLDAECKKNPVLNMLSNSLQINFIEDIEFKRLQKLSVNVVINPVTAYFKIKNGEILLHPAAWEMAGKIIVETFPFWRKEGVFPSMLKYEDMVVNIAEKTANNYSSMCSAVLNNVPLELNNIVKFVYQKTKSKTLAFLLKKLQ